MSALSEPLTIEQIKEQTDEQGILRATVRLTWLEIVEEDPAGLDNLISERICGDAKKLCCISHESIVASSGTNKNMYVELAVATDPRLLFAKD